MSYVTKLYHTQLTRCGSLYTKGIWQICWFPILDNKTKPASTCVSKKTICSLIVIKLNVNICNPIHTLKYKNYLWIKTEILLNLNNIPWNSTMTAEKHKNMQFVKICNSESWTDASILSMVKLSKEATKGIVLTLQKDCFVRNIET